MGSEGTEPAENCEKHSGHWAAALGKTPRRQARIQISHFMLIIEPQRPLTEKAILPPLLV